MPCRKASRNSCWSRALASPRPNRPSLLISMKRWNLSFWQKKKPKTALRSFGFCFYPCRVTLSLSQNCGDQMEYVIIRPGGLKSDGATGNGILTEDVNVCGSIQREDVAELIQRCVFSATTKNIVSVLFGIFAHHRGCLCRFCLPWTRTHCSVHRRLRSIWRLLSEFAGRRLR